MKGRLIDHIRWEGLEPMPWFSQETADIFSRAICEVGEKSHIFIADNVAEYFWQTSDQEIWEYKDHVNVAPPFPEFWVEFKNPAFSNSREFGKVSLPQDILSGVYFKYETFDAQQFSEKVVEGFIQRKNLPRGLKAMKQRALQRVLDHLEECFAAGMTPEQARETISEGDFILVQNALLEDRMARQNPLALTEEVSRSFEEDDRWIVSATIYMQRGEDRPMGPFCFISGIVKKSGAIRAAPPATVGDDTSQDQGALGDQMHKAALTGSGAVAHCAFLTLSFLHCRNVSTSDVHPNPGLSRKYRRKHGAPLVRYKVLKINEVKKAAKAQGGGGAGILNALHICRGHFKDFTKGKGLFGKFKGTFWWGPQIRGSKKQGVVVKDYDVGGDKHGQSPDTGSSQEAG